MREKSTFLYTGLAKKQNGKTNMTDDTNEKHETNNDKNDVKSSGENGVLEPHDTERTWRIITLVIAAVVVVIGVLCFNKQGTDNGNTSNTESINITNSNMNGARTSVDVDEDAAYSMDSPLPEDRINTKIKDVCPSETYVIKSRNIGTDSSGNPYADYECAVTSGRDLTFEVKDYVVEENGTKHRGFYCDYVKNVANFHKKAVEDVLKGAGLDYSVEKDGMTYDVKIPDDNALQKFSEAFVEISTEYAGSEASYNTHEWLDKTNVISFVPTGSSDGGSETISCTSEIPDVLSVSEKVKSSIGMGNGVKSKTALDQLMDKYDVDSSSIEAVEKLINRSDDSNNSAHNASYNQDSPSESKSLASVLAERSGTEVVREAEGAARLRADLESQLNVA